MNTLGLNTVGGTLVIILVMAVVTLATRWDGILVMPFVPIGRRTQPFISAMSGSVLVALLALQAVKGDNGARLALLVTATTMLMLKKSLPAIAAGIIAAAMWRHAVSITP